MTYGPPPNQGWQQPPGYQPGYQPGHPPAKPALPGIVVTLGVLAIVLAIGSFLLSGNIIGLAGSLTLLAGGIMTLLRQRAGVILIIVGASIKIVLTILAAISRAADLHWSFTYWIRFELEDDWQEYLRVLFAIAVLVIALLPSVTRALGGGRGGPPPGYPAQPYPQPGYPQPGYPPQQPYPQQQYPPQQPGYGQPPQQPPQWR